MNTANHRCCSCKTMSDLNRGIMKFQGADNPLAIGLSAVLILGSIGLLILWGLNAAYSF
ncbi:PilI type IV pilus biogenesis protein [Synechococcus elongatus PCC 7942 = FACHB-805]|nr:PilI type IV pilus biogenesis protein [Synechococcus elongatus]WKW06961.1 PilI type IV pilus biogenesis protein [Synechococcus elongatus PCC 7942 = FACHB-805]